MAHNSKYDIADSNGTIILFDMAYDSQCDMYYDPESDDMVRGDEVTSNHWEVISTGEFPDWRLNNPE